MNDEPSNKVTRRLRRLLPLLVLATAAALVVAQLSKAIQHDVTVHLDLTGSQVRQMETLEMVVSDLDEEVVSLTQFRFDSAHRPGSTLTHTLQLVSGDYRLAFRMYTGSSEPRVVHRDLAVDGDASVRYRLE